jgi:hypothetical protein
MTHMARSLLVFCGVAILGAYASQAYAIAIPAPYCFGTSPTKTSISNDCGGQDNVTSVSHTCTSNNGSTPPTNTVVISWTCSNGDSGSDTTAASSCTCTQAYNQVSGWGFPEEEE